MNTQTQLHKVEDLTYLYHCGKQRVWRSAPHVSRFLESCEAIINRQFDLVQKMSQRGRIIPEEMLVAFVRQSTEENSGERNF